MVKKLLILPTISLLGVHLKKIKTESQRDIYTLMSIAASFTIVKLWKQPKHQLERKLIKDESSIGHSSGKGQHADDTTVMAEGKKEVKSLGEGERGEGKSWLQTQHAKN